MSKPTITEIESVVAAAEAAIATYNADKAAIYAKREAGELSYPAAEKARLAASVAPARAVRALEAIVDRAGDEGVDGERTEALADRAEKAMGWKG